MFPITFKQYVLISFGLLIGLFVYLLNIYDYYLFHIIMHVTITKASTMIITNAGLITLFFIGKLILNMFVGRLREIEIEEILDQGRMFLLDTIFFLLFSSPTIDNIEVGAMVLSRYITLVLILKLLHLISHIRINHMFELERPKTMNVIRIATLLNILLIIDLSLIFKYYLLLSRDSTLRLWVFFESVSLFISCVISIGKYMVHIIDLKLQSLQLIVRQNDEHSNSNDFDYSSSSHNFVWSNKNATLFYMEVIGDVCSLVTYLLFIILFLLLNPSRIPLYIMGDIFHVLKALYSKLSSFRKYRKLTKNMETKFQEATLEEIERIDTCIVCRDILYIGSKKIPCGHVFHLDCLKSWFIQQQTCPICRSNINIQDEDNESNSNNDNNVPEDDQINDHPDNFNNGAQELNISEDTSLNNNNNNNMQFSMENNIKNNFKNIMKNILGNNQVTINNSSLRSSYNEDINYSNRNNVKNKDRKIYEVSKHPLLNRIQNDDPKEDINSCNEEFAHILPPQILSIQPQILFDLNKILTQNNIKDNEERRIFSLKICEIYKKNVEIWLNKVNKLINDQNIEGILYKDNRKDGQSIDINDTENEMQGDNYIQENSSLYNNNYAINPLEDLFNIMKSQSELIELNNNGIDT